MAKAIQKEVVFSGPPSKMLLVDGELESKRAIKFIASDKLVDVSQLKLKGQPKKAGRPMRIRSKQNLPPGIYQVVMEQDGKQTPLSFEVQKQVKIKTIPNSIEASISMGEKAIFKMLVINLSNVPIEIKAEHVFGIFDDEGMETAFAKAYRSSGKNALEMLDAAFNSMRDSHGGMVKLRIKKGAGKIDVDRQVMLEGELQFDSNQIKAGHNYHGAWTMIDHNISLSLSIAK